MERFWSKVDKSGDCWLWTASCARSGYGQYNASPERGASGQIRSCDGNGCGNYSRENMVMGKSEVKVCGHVYHARATVLGVTFCLCQGCGTRWQEWPLVEKKK